MNFTVTRGDTVLNFTVSNLPSTGSGSSAWADITGKPTTFPPSTHNHDDRYYTETEADTLLAGKAPLAHTQTASTITDITEAVQDIVAGMLAAGTNVTLSYNDTTGSLSITAAGGAELTDGDKGDVVVSNGGATLSVPDLATKASLIGGKVNPAQLEGADFPTTDFNVANVTVDGETVKRFTLLDTRIISIFNAYLQSLPGYVNNNTVSLRGNLTWEAAGAALTQLATPTLTATVVSDTQINLSWTNVANETSYKLEWSANGSTGWTQIGGTIAADTTTYNHTGLTAATQYYYRVSAIGNGTTHSNSNFGTANGTTQAAPVVGVGTVVLRETFPNSTAANIEASTLNWLAYYNSTGTQVTIGGTQAGISNAIGKGSIVPLNAGYTTEDDNGILYVGGFAITTDLLVIKTTQTIARTGKRISQAAWQQGHNTTTRTTRFAIKIGSQWYASEQTTSQVSAVSSGGNFSLAEGTGAEAKALTLSEAAGQWRLINFTTAGNGLSLGALTAAVLPAGDIVGYGWYVSGSATNANNVRFDTLEISTDNV